MSSVHARQDIIDDTVMDVVFAGCTYLANTRKWLYFISGRCRRQLGVRRVRERKMPRVDNRKRND
jgi:hypothetical protein